MNSITPTCNLRAHPSILAPARLSPSIPLLPRPQCRHATLLRRPKRPYTFTQLVALSDGSTYLHRTTSPAPVYRSTKDTRNVPLWNPSSQKLLSFEADEAGRLRAFRAKFGRGWDAASGAIAVAERGGDAEGDAGRELVVEEAKEEDDNLMDLISGYTEEGEGSEAKDTKDKKGGK